MFKKLSCGLLALSVAFSSAPTLLNGVNSTIGVVGVSADSGAIQADEWSGLVTCADIGTKVGSVGALDCVVTFTQISGDTVTPAAGEVLSDTEFVRQYSGSADTATFSGIKLTEGATYVVTLSIGNYTYHSGNVVADATGITGTDVTGTVGGNDLTIALTPISSTETGDFAITYNDGTNQGSTMTIEKKLVDLPVPSKTG